MKRAPGLCDRVARRAVRDVRVWRKAGAWGLAGTRGLGSRALSLRPEGRGAEGAGFSSEARKGVTAFYPRIEPHQREILQGNQGRRELAVGSDIATSLNRPHGTRSAPNGSLPMETKEGMVVWETTRETKEGQRGLVAESRCLNPRVCVSRPCIPDQCLEIAVCKPGRVTLSLPPLLWVRRTVTGGNGRSDCQREDPGYVSRLPLSRLPCVSSASPGACEPSFKRWVGLRSSGTSPQSPAICPPLWRLVSGHRMHLSCDVLYGCY